MEIRYRGITSERTEDAPFVGALICAVDCKFKCKGCFNRDLKKGTILTNTGEEIIQMVKTNPFNEGIILGGLEWSLQPQELIELVTLASKAGLQVMIYTGCTLIEFQNIIGVSCAEKVGYSEVIKQYTFTPDDVGIYTFIGGMVLDTVIDGEYYVKCGRYDRTQPTTDREHFGVKLASKNQTIYKFVKVEDEQNGKTEESYVTSGGLSLGDSPVGDIGITTSTESEAG